MFSGDERDAVRERLLRRAADDPSIVGAAITGSQAAGAADRWSDIDIALGVDGPLDAAMRRWTADLYQEFGALHHWDLPSGSSTYRVFLLPGCLEVDIAFTPSADFGPRGPHWRTVFGTTAPPVPAVPLIPDNLAGLAWHHALHARMSIERGRWWQAEYWISALRDEIVALACRRLGHPTSYAKGAHLLRAEVTDPLVATLVRGLDEAELRRALAAATAALGTELARTDASLAARLAPALAEINAVA
ncbi:MAG TPA: hypothetical protein VKB69_12800 [Micromonosporaceae bacterium]|nr:hypothetical protein [Micromonosporaceae bacterium]